MQLTYLLRHLHNEALHIFHDKLENHPGLRTRKSITFNNLMNMLTSFVWI